MDFIKFDQSSIKVNENKQVSGSLDIFLFY